MRTIRIYGALAKFVGRRSFEAVANSAAEAVRFLAVNFPGLDAHMAQYHYAFLVGGETINPHEQFHDPVGQAAEICVVPVLGGAGGAVGRIIAGIGLVALSFVTAGATIGLFGLAAPLAISPILLGLGASMALGGVAELLSPVPVLSGPGEWGQDDARDPRKNFAFSGISNTARVGMIVPFGYGKSWTGSLPVSQTIDLIHDVPPYVEPIVIGDISIYGPSNHKASYEFWLTAVQSGNAPGTSWDLSVSPSAGVTVNRAWAENSSNDSTGYGISYAIILPSAVGVSYTFTFTATNASAKDSFKSAIKTVTRASNSASPAFGYGPFVRQATFPLAVGVAAVFYAEFPNGAGVASPDFAWSVTPSSGVVMQPDSTVVPGGIKITFPDTKKYIVCVSASKTVDDAPAINNGITGSSVWQAGYVLGSVNVAGPTSPAANTFNSYTATQGGLPAAWAWEVTPAGATITGSGATVSIRFPSAGNWQVRATATNANATNSPCSGILIVTAT